MNTHQRGAPNHHTPAPQEEEDTNDDQTRLIERPDGYYWQDNPTEKMYGPFATRTKAMEDMQYLEDNNFEEGETLEEAEAEIGMADWIDPDTGQPAEGSTPHLNDK